MDLPAWKISLLLGFLAVGLVFGPTVEAPASEAEKGAEKIVLTGGVSGDVPFPHRVHQQSLESCERCHDLYPQESGVIDRLKERSELQPKTVMNRQCTACHREKKRAGEAAGPTTCRGCHQKR